MKPLPDRPKISISPKPIDRALDLTSLLMLLGLWILAIVAYIKLPDVIPIHFDGSGRPNGYGGKATLFILPAIASVLSMLLGAVNGYPHVFNYPVEITAENAERQYTNATRFMRWLRLCLLLTFLIVVAYTWMSAANGATNYGPLLLIAILVLTFLPLLIYLFTAMRKKP